MVGELPDSIHSCTPQSMHYEETCYIVLHNQPNNSRTLFLLTKNYLL